MVLAHIRKQGFFAVIRQTGFKGLYFGWSSTLYRDISFNSAFFTSREMLVRTYREWYGEDPNAKMRVVLGIPAGSLGSLVACPFDVVKTRMQGNELGMSCRGRHLSYDLTCVSVGTGMASWNLLIHCCSNRLKFTN